jgi:hypothetical protein
MTLFVNVWGDKMALQVFHQAGHITKWNIDSFREDRVGDGIIIAPRYLKKEKVETYFVDEPNTHIFDPQFYYPNYARGKLTTYNFFPKNVAPDFNTSDYQENHATGSAQSCVDFQVDNSFRYIVIPCRYYKDLPSDFIGQQEALYVSPFLSAIEESGSDTPVLLQLVITSAMLSNEDFFNDLLTWLTGLQDIDGVYLILKDSRLSKQMKDPSLLLSYLKFIFFLIQNELDVLIGYLNTEGLLLSLTDPTAITIGSYETQRSFNPTKYGHPDESSGGPPNARIYIPALFQWVEFTYLNTLKTAVPEVYSLIPQNKYQAIMFEPNFKWHFSKPALYKHYFLEYHKQAMELSELSLNDRFSFLVERLIEADNLYRLIQERGVYLDINSDGSHIGPWLTAANQFAKFVGWI